MLLLIAITSVIVSVFIFFAGLEKYQTVTQSRGAPRYATLLYLTPNLLQRKKGGEKKETLKQSTDTCKNLFKSSNKVFVLCYFPPLPRPTHLTSLLPGRLLSRG